MRRGDCCGERGEDGVTSKRLLKLGFVLMCRSGVPADHEVRLVVADGAEVAIE